MRHDDEPRQDERPDERLAFLFPGQGAQRVGMGGDLVADRPELRERYFDAADEILGMPLTRLMLEGPEEELARTENTQPALLVASMAVLDVLRSAGVAPRWVAGHSLGEYSALVCAGVLGFADALRLVRRRGELMARVNETTPGTMAAVIGPPPEAVEEICARARRETGGVVEPANYNDREQTVVSGELRPVDRASELAREAGARVVALRVGAPFHSSLMAGLEAEFGAELDKTPFADPRIAVAANATGGQVADAVEVREALRRQVSAPVRWTRITGLLVHAGCTAFVEVGPGRALTGFAMKDAPDVPVHSVGQARRLARFLERHT